MSETVKLTGTVEDLFGHRFTLKSQNGKQLIDLGPDADIGAELQPGQSVEIKGEQKKGEVKAKSVRIAEGEWIDVKGGGKPDPKGGKHDGGSDDAKAENAHGISDEQVTATLNDAGYSDHGEKTHKPKHVEVAATKDGQRHNVHVHKDGVKKAEPVA